MSTVYNWQLGRDMDYPYEAAYPDSQFAFVFNLNRCIGCQSCTMACKSTWTFSKGQEAMWWNNVETKPYGGYPHNWDVKTLNLLEEANPGGQFWNGAPKQSKAPYGQFKGKTVFEAAKTNISPEGAQRALGYLPADDEWAAPNRFEDNPAGAPYGKPNDYTMGASVLPEHKTWFFYLARICNHCSYPACLAACPRNAIYKRPEDGIVLIDQERCRGYRKCMEACPYKKTHYRGTTRTTEKCIGCFPRIEGRDQEGKGLPMQTRCMAGCIGHIRLQGLVQMNSDGTWKEDRYNPMYYLVHVAKVALPLYPQFGTEPNGYYIPPRWVPRPYLRQMFGPGVDEAIERYTHPDRELSAVLQLFGKDSRISFRYEIKPGPKVYETTVNGRKFELFNDTIIGYSRNGEKVVECTMEEPLHVRSPKHANSISRMNNCSQPAQSAKRSVFGNYQSSVAGVCPVESEIKSSVSTPIAESAVPLQEAIDSAIGRSFVYRFLAQAFEYPERDTWRSLCNKQLHETLRQAVDRTFDVRSVELLETVLLHLDYQKFENYEAAYIAAFGHSARGNCPANEIEYGDIKADPLFQPHRLADLGAFYCAFGLELSDDAPERLDHICVQLEFMSVLLAKEAYALEHQFEQEPLAVCRDAQKKFLREHLARWSPAFTRRLAETDGDGPLAALARLAQTFIAAECARFGFSPGSEELMLRPVDDAAERLCESCGISNPPPGALAPAAD